MHGRNDFHIVPNVEVQNAHLFVLLSLFRSHLRGVGAVEAAAARWSVQPDRYVDEVTTGVGGGKGLPVCLCKRARR